MIHEEPIDAYLDEVMASLRDSRRDRTEMVAELRSSLLDAVDSHRDGGLSMSEATRAAIEEFGRPDHVAEAFRPELTARRARRLALALVGGGTVNGVLWLHAAQVSDAGSRHTSPWSWIGSPPLPMVAAAFVLAVATASVTIAVTGRLTRWLPDRPQLAASAAAVSGLGSAGADLAILMLLAAQVVMPRSALAPFPVAVAALASVVRFTIARRAAQRLRFLRAPASLEIVGFLRGNCRRRPLNP